MTLRSTFVCSLFKNLWRPEISKSKNQFLTKCICPVLSMSKPTQFKHEEAYKEFWSGLSQLDLKGPAAPGNLLLNGGDAFPLLMNTNQQTLIAASVFGKGRIVAVGHEEYLKGFPVLVEKALVWLRGGGSGKFTVGVHKDLKAVADNLKESMFKVSVVETFSESSEFSAYVTDAYSVKTNPQKLVAFLKSGGGILIAGQSWSWEGKNPGKTIFEFPGNKVSGVAGIYFTGQSGKVEHFSLPPEIPASWTSIQVWGKNFKDELDILLKGISEFGQHENLQPSEVLAHASLAFPIGLTNDESVFLAGSYYGLGRVIVVGHEHFMSTECQTVVSFWKNAIHWLDQGRGGVVGFKPGSEIWKNLGLKCEQTMFKPDLSVYVCKAYRDEHAEEIQNFVAEGGGLVIGGQAAVFEYSGSDKRAFRDFPGNKILKNMGLSLLGHAKNKGSFKCVEPIQANKMHFRHLLSYLAEDEKDDPFTEQEEKFLRNACRNFLQLKMESFYYKQVLLFLTGILKKSNIAQMNKNNPANTSKDRVLLGLAKEVFNVTSNQDALLPYLLKDAPSFPLIHNQRIKITANTKEIDFTAWISTGLYLPPGVKTSVTMPSKLVKNGWEIQIGCQSDELNHKKLERAPLVCETFPVTSEVVEVWNLWGGLIYVVAPRNVKVDGEEVIVKTSVSAPFYKSGVTPVHDWPKLREAPAPWAEFEFDNIILTVPSHVVRSMESECLGEVEKLWNDIMKAVADLAAIPQTLDRKERMVADVQISFGLLHSGYPIMMHVPDGHDLFKPEIAKTKGIWGPIHELGHNQQKDCWEFKPHTTEATCNLWSVYVHEEVLGVNRAEAHEELPLKLRNKRLEKYVREGKSLTNWEIFKCLETYLQLQEKFGWDAFKKVFAAYNDMKSYPKENKEKINLYTEIFSQVVQMNLCDFFKDWGLPIEETTEKKLSTLPSWSDHPMVKYT